MTDWSYLHVERDGDDLVVRGARATRFGDASDDEDNGIGASGFHTAAHPEYAGVSLPSARGAGVLDGLFVGCPIPHLPWFTPIRVWSPETNIAIYTHLIDLGPHPRTHTPIDLSLGTINQLGLDPKEGVYKVDFRIIGGARYIVESGS